jgi:hypothetical protein
MSSETVPHVNPASRALAIIGFRFALAVVATAPLYFLSAHLA